MFLFGRKLKAAFLLFDINNFTSVANMSAKHSSISKVCTYGKRHDSGFDSSLNNTLFGRLKFLLAFLGDNTFIVIDMFVTTI